ncbi:MAG: pentapeptide repeat-containing protein [Calothrix sp. C42_A2020_038]|nr:pentapeptide repeat-containing protein [Calothrix sp. C42_A2020_038]
MRDIQNLFNSLLASPSRPVLLFDSVEKAEEVAFMLKGEWDGCNGVIIYPCDEIAVKSAASLIGASWCYQGDTRAFIDSMKATELIQRYARGEKNFINVNLRCANLSGADLSETDFSWAKLSLANFSRANLSKTNLTGADASETDFNQANLINSHLVRTNFQLANLQNVCLRGAYLSHVSLDGANLTGADLRGAKIHYTNMINSNITDTIFE